MKEKASGALWNLAVNVENREEIARAGGIQPLVAVLRSGTDVAQEKAAAALKNLATSNANNQMEIGAQGGVVRLLEVCRNGSEKAQEKAAGALCNLAVHEGNRSKIIATGIPDLVALLTGGSANAKENAVACLRNLTVDKKAAKLDKAVLSDPDDPTGAKSAIVDAGALPPLIAFYDEAATPTASKLAGSLLKNLSKVEAIREKMTSLGCPQRVYDD